ncbi:MAG: hypothetical protein HRS57_00580, partial [Mycoplasmataceae bacterium]|nr:hypothetical protein [Mycoplasmataceae bacterium]
MKENKNTKELKNEEQEILDDLDKDILEKSKLNSKSKSDKDLLDEEQAILDDFNIEIKDESKVSSISNIEQDSKSLDNNKVNHKHSRKEKNQNKIDKRKKESKKNKEYSDIILGKKKVSSVKGPKEPLPDEKQNNDVFRDSYVKGKISWKKTAIALTSIAVLATSGFLIWYYPIGGKWSIKSNNAVNEVLENVFIKSDSQLQTSAHQSYLMASLLYCLLFVSIVFIHIYLSYSFILFCWWWWCCWWWCCCCWWW